MLQDGSCNGLQHYAALGRDFNGGKAVNLVPGPVPADVYTEIANVCFVMLHSMYTQITVHVERHSRCHTCIVSM